MTAVEIRLEAIRLLLILREQLTPEQLDSIIYELMLTMENN